MSGVIPCMLFDLDGTLLDSLPGIEFSIRAAFEACKLPMQRHDLRDTIGPPIRDILLRVAGDGVDQGQLDALEAAFRISYDAHGWQRTVCFPGGAEVVRTAQGRGHRLFVVSNKPRAVSLRILQEIGILSCFERVVTRDSRVPPYPDKAAMIAALLNDCPLSPGNCLFIGDTMEDATAAISTGVPFAFVTHGYGNVRELESLHQSRRLNDLTQLLAVTGGSL